MVLKLVMPDLRTVDVLEVNALATLVFVVFGVFEELVGKLAHVSEVVADGQWEGVLGRKVARMLDCNRGSDME